MDARLIAGILLTPFVAVFIYATISEIMRWKTEGRAQYGLSYDEETGTTHVGVLDENESGYDPDNFDPNALNGTTANDDAVDRTDETPRGARADHTRYMGKDTMTDDAQTAIKDTVTSNDVVLFMKGTSEAPQCGFSSRVAGVLNYMGVSYKDVNVLADEGLRQGIKDYSDWPTIPQLYIKGEFVGGCDIITEMTLSGELDQMFDQHDVAYDKDAAEKIREANG